MKLLDAAAEVDRMARSYRAMETVAEVLRNMGSVENAIIECRNKKNQIDQEIEQAKKELADVQEQISATKASAKQIVSEAKDKAKAKLEDADIQIAEKLANAEKQVNDAIARRDELNIESIAINKSIKEARAEYEGLQNRLTGIKNQIAGMLS